MGIYLPVTLVLPTVIGTVIGHVWNRMSERTARPEFTARLGVLLATGLVVGDSIFGLVFAGAVGAVGDPARLAIVGEELRAGGRVDRGGAAGRAGGGDLRDHQAAGLAVEG